MQEITLKISLDEVNMILEALGEMPFKRVYPLVNKIQEQAAQQLQQNGQEHSQNLTPDNG